MSFTDKEQAYRAGVLGDAYASQPHDNTAASQEQASTPESRSLRHESSWVSDDIKQRPADLEEVPADASGSEVSPHLPLDLFDPEGVNKLRQTMSRNSQGQRGLDVEEDANSELTLTGLPEGEPFDFQQFITRLVKQ